MAQHQQDQYENDPAVVSIVKDIETLSDFIRRARGQQNSIELIRQLEKLRDDYEYEYYNWTNREYVRQGVTPAQSSSSRS